MDSVLQLAGAASDWTSLPLADLSNMTFFSEINAFIDDELMNEYLPNLGRRVIQVLGGLGILLLTLWIMIQGYRIVTGQSRESMMALMVNSLRATFIVGVALGVAVGWGDIYGTLTDGLARTVNSTMTGDGDGTSPYENIDRTLGIMQVALQSIDSVNTDGDDVLSKERERAMWFVGVGLGSPAIMGAIALMLNKIAIGLILGLGPLFILCLLWEPVKPLFQKWLLYGIGALFSMALLSVMTTLALDIVMAVGAAFWITNTLGFGGSAESMTNMAMQQGGLGLIMTALIVSAPPMAAMLFQGTLGQFYGANAFTQMGGVAPGSQPGQGGYTGQTAQASRAVPEEAPPAGHRVAESRATY
ncbi:MULTISPECIES: type IV secretion system protein [unclassified Luteimonas]